MNIWLVGAGQMAEEYYKVIRDLKIPCSTIGRSEHTARIFQNKFNTKVHTGGIEKFIISNRKEVPSHAIVAAPVEQLYDCTSALIDYGVKNILVEKPGGLNQEQIKRLVDLSQLKNIYISVAYNRRYYSSVKKAQEIITLDGGVKSIYFEFTERADKISELNKPDAVMQQWFLANSTHVVDLAFYLAGKPKEMVSHVSGELSWHRSSSVFVGSGICDTGALFSYHANWNSAGRWGVEVMTDNHRLIFRPMEKLQIQKKGEVCFHDVDVDYTLDEKYKPGLYYQVVDFVNGDFSSSCKISDQFDMLQFYNKIAGY